MLKFEFELFLLLSFSWLLLENSNLPHSFGHLFGAQQDTPRVFSTIHSSPFTFWSNFIRSILLAPAFLPFEQELEIALLTRK